MLSWLVALATATFIAAQAWVSFDEAERRDGNWGHASIDFGGQWVMGRMIVEGRGRHLYNRTYIRSIVEAGYPPGGENPKIERTDAESLLSWLSGRDEPGLVASFLAPLAGQDPLGEAALLAYGSELWTPERLQDVVEPHLGGALYPPIHALLFAPLATLPPRTAYRVWQAINLVLLFVCSGLVHRLTEGRVWWQVALVFLVMFPGFVGCINLGQNSMLSLTLVLLGWLQLMRGRPVWAGLCCGLLAFKPVWAVSFFLVPVLTGRWRMALSMALTGLVQIGLTLPVVGWRTWLEWLQVGRIAAADYAIQENWIFLSRDLLGIPRRWLLTFESLIATHREEQPLPTALGWGLWTVVFAGTLLVVWLRRRRMRELTGPAPAFVLLGCFFSCYHFMYYDFILGGLPVLLLFTEPRRYFQVMFWRRPSSRAASDAESDDPGPGSALWWYYQPTLDDLKPPPMPLLPGGRRPRWVRAPIPPLLLTLTLALPALGCLIDPTNHFPPGETFSLLALWAWCGWRLLVDRDDSVARAEQAPASAVRAALDAVQLAELGADVGRPHERLADQHGADAGRL
jgi:hypothetical protein